MNGKTKTRLFRFCRAAVLAVPGAIALSTSALAQDAPSLPGGASSVQETYGDWRVACQITDAGRNCALSQQQAQQNGQRVLAIELRAGADESATRGVLVLPFGLRLADGIALSIDEGDTLATLPFSTCVPAGCIVPIELTADMVSAIRSGSVLSIGTVVSDTGEQIVFSVSLTGFGSAHARVVELS